MLNISNSPEFEGSFDPQDPLSRIPLQVAEAVARTLSVSMDSFVRAALKKVVSDVTLALYADDAKPLPGLDLNIEFITATKKKVTVLFRKKEIGHATFTTRMIEKKDLDPAMPALIASGGDNPQHAIIHEISDVWIID